MYSSVYPTKMLIFCRAKEAGVCARRWLDGYDPLPECLKQQQLSCWYMQIIFKFDLVYTPPPLQL